jgi:hypothetical protein
VFRRKRPRAKVAITSSGKITAIVKLKILTFLTGRSAKNLADGKVS